MNKPKTRRCPLEDAIATRIAQALDDEMADMARWLADFDHEYGPDPRLLAPLPPTTDVHARGYTYEDLRSEDRLPAPALDAAVRHVAASTVPPAGAITRALEPGRRGPLHDDRPALCDGYDASHGSFSRSTSSS